MDDFDDLEARMHEMRERAEADLAKPVPAWVWLLATAIPLLFVVIGLGLVVDAVQFASEARSARGMVIEVERVPGSDGVTYRPTIRFQRDDGRTIEATTEDSSSEYDYAQGSEVDILYVNDEPDYVRIDTFFALYGFGLIFAAFGAVFLVMLLFARRMIGGTRVRRRGYRPAMAGDQAPPGPAAPEPITDLSQYGHVHKPKPKPEPTVRRNR
jgi:hypothetical protein